MPVLSDNQPKLSIGCFASQVVLSSNRGLIFHTEGPGIDLCGLQIQNILELIGRRWGQPENILNSPMTHWVIMSEIPDSLPDSSKP